MTAKAMTAKAMTAKAMTTKGCIAAGHVETVRAAEVVLQEGGNAFDAALAALCAACLSESVLASLGGGGFMMAKPADGKPILYDFFAQTPVQRHGETPDFYPIHADFGATQQEFHIGMGAAATPGVVKGLFAIHEDLGRMPLREVVAPAVALARKGLSVAAMQANIFPIIAPILLASPESRAVYEDADNPGKTKPEGALFRLPGYEDFLETLAIEGADLFYRGEIAQQIVADSAARGGYLTLPDFEGYQVERRKPLQVAHGKAHLFTNPPPSSGGMLIAFALALAKKDFKNRTFGEPDTLLRLVRIMELTNDARRAVDFANTPAGEAAARLLAPDMIAHYKAALDQHPKSHRGTSHISVIDAQGNTASVTLSNGEGNGYFIPGTGVMLNNMLGEEDINPQGFHAWTRNIRMASMMSPSICLRDDGEILALGSGGSNRIRTAILQALINHLDFGLPVDLAVESPRLHREGGQLNIEPGFPEESIQALRDAYPPANFWDAPSMFFGGVNMVSYHPKNGSFQGAGDSRRGGAASVVR